MLSLQLIINNKIWNCYAWVNFSIIEYVNFNISDSDIWI